MQLLSDAVNQLVDSYAAVTLTVYVDGEKLEADVAKASYSATAAGGETFTFGNACASGITLELSKKIPGLKGRQIKVNWSVGNELEYALFTGRVESAPVTAGRTEVHAWDELYFSGSDSFTAPEALLTDCTAYAAFNAAATAMGLSVEVTPTMSMLAGVNISGGLADLPSDVTNAAVVGYIAALLGGNALIDRNGKLCVRRRQNTSWKTEPYSGGARAETADFNITGITMQREITTSQINGNGTVSETTITQEFAAGDGSMMMENPLADQAAADRAFENWGGVAFRPGEFSFPGGIQLEPGDTFQIISLDETYVVVVCSLRIELDGGVRTTVTCCGSGNSGGHGGHFTQALKRLQADYAELKKLVAKNAYIDSAYIEQLFSKYIETGLLDADVIKLQTGDEGRVYIGSWDELDSFVLEQGSGMAQDTQKVFGAGFDFDLYGYGTITISVGPDGNSEPSMFAYVKIKNYSYTKCWLCEGGYGGSSEHWYSVNEWEPVGASNFIGFKRVLTSEDDLDTLTELGVYRYSTSSVPANCPYSNAGMVEVIPSDGTSGIIQRVTRYGNAGYTKQRIQYNGSWNAWNQLPLMVIKTQTATTNANGNANTGISAGLRILDISATDASGGTTYLCNKYWSSSQNRWYVNVTDVANKTNQANKEFTFTIYYMVE